MFNAAVCEMNELIDSVINACGFDFLSYEEKAKLINQTVPIRVESNVDQVHYAELLIFDDSAVVSYYRRTGGIRSKMIHTDTIMGGDNLQKRAFVLGKLQAVRTNSKTMVAVSGK